MAAKLENEYGVISIDREVIARIAGYAAIECYGIGCKKCEGRLGAAFEAGKPDKGNQNAH